MLKGKISLWNRSGIFSSMLALLLCIAMCFECVPFYTVAAEETEETGTYKTKAISWLVGEKDDVSGWGDTDLINDTANALTILGREGKPTDSTFLEKWKGSHKDMNTDEMVHIARAEYMSADSKEAESLLSDIMSRQNPDGGFGLTEEYESDVYDTVLALSAVCAQAVATPTDATADYSNAAGDAAFYLAGKQKSDGGYAYTDASDSSPYLTAYAGMILSMCGCDDLPAWTALDAYCQDRFTGELSEDTFAEQAVLAMYMYRRELIQDADAFEEKLHSVQGSDGSVYGDITDTIWYILLLDEIDSYHTLRLSITNVETETDTYVLEAGETQSLSLHTDISYDTNQNVTMNVRYTITEDGEATASVTKEMELSASNTKASLDSALEATAQEGKEYILKTEIVSVDDEAEVLASDEIKFSVHVTERQKLTLTADVTTGIGYSVNLSWNDISNDDDTYRYRVFRKMNGGEWETRSTWDGSEKVRVLNIYPCYAAQNYLKNWMEQTVSDTGEPAGKGLFVIDTVYIGSYNSDPDKYLKDENGDYKYDVLMFGTYDSNAGQDLSEKGYEATKAFIDTGRGAMFGHDTLARISSCYHPNFARFADDLGIKVATWCSYTPSSTVRVVNSGMLTSYPWKLSGTLQIPSAHTLGQYSGGALSSTVWMEFGTWYSTDSETGATTAAYLVTNNQLAMIQTGHSNGQATDDERKVFANTLFYLKQLTSETSAKDNSFYDEAAPTQPDITESETGTFICKSEDMGTDYQYYVEAVSSGHGENVESNIVDATALSGMRGFITGISDSTEPMDELRKKTDEGKPAAEVSEASDGTLKIDLSEYDLTAYEPGQTVYLHICAVDNAGNISDETVISIEIPKGKEYLSLDQALIATDGEVQLYCCEADITGDIYGAETFRFQGSTIHLNGMASSAGSLSIAGGVLDIAGMQENVQPLDVPDYTQDIKDDMELEGAPLTEIAVYNSTDIIVPTICLKTTGAWCNSVTLSASLMSGGDISFNANTIHCGAEDEPVVLCSEKGDIKIQATAFEGEGLIYAPEGTVTINVSKFDYIGSVVAKRVIIQAGYYNQNRMEGE